jgi:4'-phosphopantetheinyl transferase
MSAWPVTCDVPPLAAGEVHVWSAALAVGPEQLDALSALLDADERQRAGRFSHRPSREQFIVARAVLRTLLGRYLGRAPTAVRFITGPQGKPLLGGGELHFNVSHTHGLALFAVTAAGPVGVDVEQVSPHATHLDMARRFFTPAEADALLALPPGHSGEAFFHVWTRKEAFLKAVGLGLSHGLERFAVSVPPDDPPRILHIDGDARAGARWSLEHLAPAAGYVGALAVEGAGRVVRCFAWGG